MKRITILGSTGSIGCQALEIVKLFKDEFEVVALVAGSNIALLSEQVKEFRPKYVVIADSTKYVALKESIGSLDVEVLAGNASIVDIAALANIDMVLNAIVGAAGLVPTLKAIEAGADIALANKETLVAGGEIVMKAAKEKGVRILPVDSEHSAIFQCLQGQDTAQLGKIILTASGGPFRKTPFAELIKVTPEQALKHPNWDMGGKITIDSATLMNKGLEVIEAKWLFDLDTTEIDVLVHPQSIIHSMVEFKDGAVIAQLGTPDMRLPIQYAMFYPSRRENNFPRLDLKQAAELTFEAPDYERFPCLSYAFDAIRTGGTLPVVMNAANEIAVDAFLGKRIGFMDIPKVIWDVMKDHRIITSPKLSNVLEADAWARETASGYCARQL